MAFLRHILIIFGWAIPFATVILTGVSIYMSLNYDLGGSSPFILKIISTIAGSIDDLALSPLCFFAAYMLKERTTS